MSQAVQGCVCWLMLAAAMPADLPAVTARRLVESLSAAPVLTASGDIDRTATIAAVEAAIVAERAYLAEAIGPSGRIQGMGAAAPVTPATAEQTAANLVESFRRMGMSEGAAKAAAAGR